MHIQCEYVAIIIMHIKMNKIDASNHRVRIGEINQAVNRKKTFGFARKKKRE